MYKYLIFISLAISFISSSYVKAAENILTEPPSDKNVEESPSLAQYGTGEDKDKVNDNSSSPLNPPKKAGFWKSDTPTATTHSKVSNPIFLSNDETARVHKKANPAEGTLSKENNYNPPKSFQITAAIYTNLTNGHSYFANLPPTNQGDDSAELLSIPFLDYNVEGSATVPIPFKTGTFQHFPRGADPSDFVTSPHSGQIVICLSSIELIASSGGVDGGEDRRVFGPGNAILLEDITGVGHKMRSNRDMHNHEDMKVLILSLPRSNDESDKNRGWGSKKWNIFRSKQESRPSNNASNPIFSSLVRTLTRETQNKKLPKSSIFLPAIQLCLSIVLSTGFSHGLTKVIPPWVSIGLGKIAVVGLTTFVFVKLGDFVGDWFDKTGEHH